MDGKALADFLKTEKARIAGKNMVLGFDGFVDTIVRVVKHKAKGKPAFYFEKAHHLGNYILEKEGRNLSIELEERQTKLGGNMPIMSNALARLAGKVSCIGALGYPALHPVFAPMADLCTLYSYAEPGKSTALEFDDGKILLGQMGALQDLGWAAIRERIGLPVLSELYQNCHLLALLNWGELDQSTSIWKGLIREILPLCPNPEKQIVFVDLSDCSNRSEDELMEALDLLKLFSKTRHLVLSLNLNEAERIFQVISPAGTPQMENLGAVLFEQLSLQTLVIHHARQSAAWENGDFQVLKTRYIQQPKISTGAGDHFNAGYAFGKMMELKAIDCLALGNAVSGYYLSSGSSPGWEDLLHSLTETNL